MQTPWRCNLEGKRRELAPQKRKLVHTLEAAVDEADDPVVKYG
jgi:hypothetical protein